MNPANKTARRRQANPSAPTRRALLKTAVAAGGLLAAPGIVRNALASSGSLRIVCWTNYLPRRFLEDFERSTGIETIVTPLGSNEELLAKIVASKGEGYDIITPTLNRRGQWIDLGLLQPWDLDRIPNLTNVEPSFVNASATWKWGGGQHHLPHIWGTEGMAWRTDLYRTAYGELSLGDLWLPEMRGKIQGRPHSIMAGIGRHLADIGRLPPFEDAYKDEIHMRRIWKEITRFAIAHKPWIKAFWNDHNAQKTNFMKNGCVIGQTWDGPAIELMKAGEPVRYMAPREGAFAWLDGLALPVGATNKEQAHAFVNAVYTPEAAAQMANSSGYNATVKGVSALLDDKTAAAFAAAYPDDALINLWWWPDEPSWYAKLRDEYRDRFISA